MTRSSLAGSASEPLRLAGDPRLAGFLSGFPEWFRQTSRHMSPGRWIADIGIGLSAQLLLGWPIMLDGVGRVYFLPELIIVSVIFVLAVAMRRWRPATALIVALSGIAVKFAFVIEPHGQDIAVFIVVMACAAYGSRVTQLVSLACCMLLPMLLVCFYLINPPRSIVSWLFSSVLPFGPVVLTLALVLLIFFPVCATFFTFWFVGFTRRLQVDARDSRHRRELAELENERNQEQLIVEQERNRIARDMHDVVAHSLAVVVAQANGGRYAMRADPKAGEETLETISDTAREALTEVRGLLAQLRHSQPDGPQRSFADLPGVIERMRRAGLRISVTGSGSPRRLGPNADIALFWLVQEALTNALRHGDRSVPVTITVDWGPWLAVRIENVIAAEPRAAKHSSGHGLIGMRERVGLAGGEVETGRDQDHFIVRARVPTLDRVLPRDGDDPESVQLTGNDSTVA